MTFDELWPMLVIPGEFDAMDQCDQRRWRGVLEQAFDEGRVAEHKRWSKDLSEARNCAEKYRYRADDCGYISRLFLQMLRGLEQTP